jgi:TolB-like protein/class 3 adenylate cyclase/Flp pilus assembly protein TadD
MADVVGYSRQMEHDEAGTIERLKSMRREVVEPQTRRFRGRIVDTAGDGWLAEFSSVTDAVRSSLAIQDAMQVRNAELSRDARFEIRIGINLGEVVCDGDAIFGNGVNVAARLEALAEPGGICVSSAVHDQLRGLPDVACDDLGEQKVKNIARPVHCYAIRVGPHRRIQAAAGSARAMPSASIAVLPFANLSSDPHQDYFADGMVEDITTALSRFRQLFVIARNSTFAYKGRSVDVRQVARELGVRYVLEGSVRRAGDVVRLTAQLIDASTGGHLWAERFDGELTDVFDLQDRITEKVVGAIEPQMRRAEIERARRTRTESMEAYDHFLRALPHAYVMRAEDNARALGLFLETLRLDPNFMPAAAYAAWCYEQRVGRHWTAAPVEDAAEAVRLAQLVLRSDSEDENAISLSGFVLLRLGYDYDTAIHALRRAAELNPNNAFVAMNAGWGQIFAGDIDRGLTYLERARELSPSDPTAFYVLTGLAMAHALQGRFEEALAFAETSVALYGDWDATCCVLVFINARLGHLEAAKATLEKLLRLIPGMTVSASGELMRFRDAGRLALVQDGLRLAGMPE